MDKVKIVKVEEARKQMVRSWTGWPRRVKLAVRDSGARQRPLRLHCRKGFTPYIYTLM
jgi:hypothetical protein